MRTKLRTGLTLIAACLGCLPGARAQPAAGAGAGRPDNVAEDIGPDHRVRPGRIAGRSVVEIGTGMNHWDGKQWVPSDAAFDLTKDAFVADRLNFQVRLEGNLNTVGAVTVVTPDGTKLKSSPIGFGLHDPVTGASLVIASVADCVGGQTAANTVVYENAFAGVCANVVYHIAPGSFEQDVVLTGKLDPAAYGFDPRTVQLQIFTEFYGVPEPETVRRPIRVEQDPAVRRQRVEPDLFDDVLGFGQFVLGTGRAFTARSSGESGVAVAKTLAQVEGRTILIETLDYALLQKEFAALPDCLLAPGGAALGAKRTAGYAGLPKAGANGQAKASPAKTAPRRTFAAVNPPANKTAGIVVDYQATLGGTISSATIFRGDTTYFINGPVYCNGAATIEGGAVFKYPTGTSCLRLNGTVTCKTSPYRPAVFTAADDDTIGDPLDTGIWPGYTGTINPGGYGNPALWLYYTSPNLGNLRFHYAQEAVRFEGVNGSLGTLSHSQLANCIRGIVVNGSGSGSGGSSGATLAVNNTLLGGVQYPININNGSFSGSWTHCTIDSATRLVTATAATTVTAKNSVFANMGSLYSGSVTLDGNNNGFYAATGFGTAPTSSGGNPFQIVGAGRYYLATSSVFRDLGTTTGIAPTLLADLQLRTTFPPQILAGTITTNTTLGLQAARDTGLPDLGYHYDPLDYAVNTLDVTNAVLTLANGVALATYGSYGLVLRDNSQLQSAGTPLVHNHFVRFYNVQDQPTNWGGATLSTAVSLSPYTTGASPPSARLGFTDFDGLAGGGYHLYTQSNHWNFALLQLKDCTFNSGLFALDGPATSSLSLSNNLFERVNASFLGSATVAAYNNLFRYGTNTLVNAGGAWTFQDNVYDLSVITASGSAITASYNAYITTNLAVTGRFTPTNANDVVLGSFTYASGALGSYYQSSTNLANKGSRTADLAGLYHYTTTTSNVKETNSVVDIGYHYVPLASYQASEGFSGTLGQNPWSYRHSDTRKGLPAGLMDDYLTGNAWWHYSQDYYCIVGAAFQAPGDTHDSVRTFAAPFTGHILITGGIRNYDSTGTICGDGIEYRVLRNTNAVQDWATVYRSATWIPLSLETDVQAGDLIQFQVSNHTGNKDCDSTDWDPLITYPERAPDLDGDGLPDYLEDANGNGVADSGETSWIEADSDFDGIGDGEERANGTDPLDPASTTRRLLASFRFNTTNWLGDQGQAPVSTRALTNEPGVEGMAVPITGAAYSKILNYRTVEPNGRPNLAFASGTVLFWFKPNWASTSLGGTGPDPGAWGRLFNLGEWSPGATYGFWDIGLDPGGTQISLGVQDGLGHSTGTPWGSANLASNTWVHVAVTYSPTSSAVYFNGALINGAAWGSLVPPKAVRDRGFFVGSDTSGAQQAQGSYDLLEIYNYPMTASQISSNHVWTVQSGRGFGAQLFRPNGKAPVH